jgi:hypothetical protein
MNKWKYVHTFDEYYDFEKEVLTCSDEGDTSLDVRLTFNVETHTAYMTVAWHNNDGNTVDLDGDRYIDWNSALRLIEADVEIPEELYKLAEV